MAKLDKHVLNIATNKYQLKTHYRTLICFTAFADENKTVSCVMYL